MRTTTLLYAIIAVLIVLTGVQNAKLREKDNPRGPRVTALCTMTSFGTWVVTLVDEDGNQSTAEEKGIVFAFSTAIDNMPD
jgi:hypothetical protein